MAKKPVSNPPVSDAAAFVKTCPNGPSVFQQASHVESRFMVQIPDGDSLDDICKPSYWAHHAARVTPKSLLTCIDQRLRWEADLRVLEAGRNYLRVAVVRHVEYDVKALGQPEIERLRGLHTIESNGQNGWRVVDPDGIVLFAGLTSRIDAEWSFITMTINETQQVGQELRVGFFTDDVTTFTLDVLYVAIVAGVDPPFFLSAAS